VHARATL